MLTAIKRYSFFFAAGLALCAAWSAPARAAKAPILELGFTDQEIMAAFDKMLDDPFFEQFTGLTIQDKASFSGRRMGGTQSFRFEKWCFTKTTTQHKDVSTQKRYDGVYEVTKRWSTTDTTRKFEGVRYLSYIPTLEPTNKPGVVKLYCDAGEFGKGKDPDNKGLRGAGGILAAIGKGLALGALAVMGTSIDTSCGLSPYDPSGYAAWIEKKWLPWRLRHFLPGAEDKLDKAFTAFRKKNYDEALPLFEEFAAHFSYTKNKVPKNNANFKVWPFTYSSQMPEIFAILGDIYRLHVKDMARAEENYRIAYSVADSLYLAETAGIARANRGLGYTLAERAKAAAGGPDKELFSLLGEGASFHLYAYIGFYKDREAPDHAAVMALIKEVDPDEIREREREAERAEKLKQGREDVKKNKEKLKAIMEY